MDRHTAPPVCNIKTGLRKWSVSPQKQRQRHMEPFEVHILGCGSAKPSIRHIPSAQIVNVRNKYFLVDCGEGAQKQMQHMHLAMMRIGHVFISHNHGDHVFGLPGLISTMSMLGRTADLHIHAPQQTADIVNFTLSHYCSDITYKVEFHPIDTRAYHIIYEDRSVTVWSIPLKHRLPCSGFLFREKSGLPHIRRDMMDAYGIPYSQVNNIKAGASWTTEDGNVIPHERLTTPADKARSYAYCSDTAYMPSLATLLQGIDLLYHEATYPDDKLLQAEKYFHSTASQAAMLAKDAKVGKLCIGHFSASINNEEALLEAARAVFPNTLLAKEGLSIKL